MEFDILDVINDATKESDSFEFHPMCQHTIEEQLLYLNGLALVMNADGHIDDSEKEYVRILIKSFGLEQSALDDMVNFAKAPDKDTVQAFFTTFRRRPIAQLFLFDALMMTRRDGKVEDKEKAVVDKIAQQLEVLKGTQQDIFDLFCHIKNRNWQESALYFSSHLLNPEHFKHLLAYHEIDFDELMAETSTIRTKRLIETIKQKVNAFQWEPLKYRDERCVPEQTEITNCFFNDFLTPEMLMPYLQAQLDRGELRVAGNDIFRKTMQAPYACLNSLGLVYNQETVAFSIRPDFSSDDKLTLLKELFVDFIRLLGAPLQYDEKVSEDKGNEMSGFIGSLGAVYGFGDLSPEQPENTEVEHLNQWLKLLFSAQIAHGKRYSDDDPDVCFPKCGGEYLSGEIVLGHNGKFYLNDGSREYVSRLDSQALSICEILTSGKFRLIR